MTTKITKAGGGNQPAKHRVHPFRQGVVRTVLHDQVALFEHAAIDVDPSNEWLVRVLKDAFCACKRRTIAFNPLTAIG